MFGGGKGGGIQIGAIWGRPLSYFLNDVTHTITPMDYGDVSVVVAMRVEAAVVALSRSLRARGDVIADGGNVCDFKSHKEDHEQRNHGEALVQTRMIPE